MRSGLRGCCDVLRAAVLGCEPAVRLLGPVSEAGPERGAERR